MNESRTPRPERIELWLLPAPFDLAEDNWRAITVTFRPEASVEQTFEELFELAIDFDVDLCNCELEPPFEDVQLATCDVRFEADVTSEIAAMLLLRAAYLVQRAGIPTESNLIVLSEPDRVWSSQSWSREQEAAADEADHE
jgi:hypothetical protein